MKKLEITPVLKTPINAEIPITYHHLNTGEKKPLLIFLHGFSDTAQSFLRRAYPDLDDRYEILAINGLFPVPQKKEDTWKPAFAWYFVDFSTNAVLIPPDVSAKAIGQLIEKLGLVDRQKVLIGFSQGGFFLPFVLPQLKNVKYLIGIGAAYREHSYHYKLPVPLDAIHGTVDDVVPFALAEKSFQTLHANINPDGKFYRFEGLGHTMNDESRSWLKKRIDEIFSE